MYTSLFLLCCLLGHLTAISLSESTDEDTKRGDEYVDKMLKEIQENDDNFDPRKLEGIIDFVLDVKVIFLDVKAKIQLLNGNVTGMKSLHRSGPCSLIQKGNTLEIHAKLATGALQYKYNGVIKLMEFGPSITVNAVIESVDVDMVITVDADTGENGVLSKFRMNKIGGITITVDGLGPLNWVLNTLLKAVSPLLQGVNKRVMETVIAEHVKNHVKEYKFPGKGDVTDTTPSTSSTTAQEEKDKAPQFHPLIKMPISDIQV